MHRTSRWLLLIVPLALGAGAADASGTLSGPQERAALLAARRERLHQKWEAQFRAADADGDRRLTRDEAAAAHLPSSLLEHFADIDADADGALTPEELLAVYDRRLKEQHSVETSE